MRLDIDPSGMTIASVHDPNGPAVRGFFDCFHTGNAAGRKEGEHRIPVVWRPEAQLKTQQVGRCLLLRPLPQLIWTQPVTLPENRFKAAETAKASSIGDIGDR